MPERADREAARAAPVAPRVALIGARVARQGLGPWVAAHLAAAGAQVVAHLGTSLASAEQAAADLLRLAGVHSLPCTDGEQLIERGRPDALAILAPAEHHLHWLRFALHHGLPTLCEKPLVWGGERPAETARELVAAFTERGLTLLENCQWPETIPAYDALFGKPRPAKPHSFFMRLSPARLGEAMLGDALPHPLSLLAALAPSSLPCPVEQPRFSTGDKAARQLDLEFTWVADSGPLAARVTLVTAAQQPRIAAWGLDDRIARRFIRQDDYAQFLAAGAALVPLPDPLGLHVTRWLTSMADGSQEDRRREAARMVQRMDCLERLAHSYLPGAPPRTHLP